jgi:predicted nuclease of predicted toxin-antitoxin system
MALFLIDEDLPRSIARGVLARGGDAVHVVDAGLRGAADPEVLASAVAGGRTFVTADKEFGNVLTYPPEQHAGIVLVRISEAVDPAQRVERVVDALLSLVGEDLSGAIVVVEPARMRFRRAHVEK